MMESESGEQVGDELENVTSPLTIRVLCARLTEWDRKLIPEMRWCAQLWNKSLMQAGCTLL